MQSVIHLPLSEANEKKHAAAETVFAKTQQPAKPERILVHFFYKLRILWFAIIILKKPAKISAAVKTLLRFRTNFWGGDLKKMHKVGGRYYFNQFMPGWPSRGYDDVIKNVMQRQADPIYTPQQITMVILAITRKCPLQCEHCFEWDNLNKKESFSKEELLKVIELYQRQGVPLFHFSGGEPMVRIKDLLELIQYASKKSDCWLLTSGFNFTKENAQLLKKAGCNGVGVSIDHYIPELHNRFRGSNASFDDAVNAVKEARQAGMATSIGVCATKNFIDGGHLLPYLNFAKSLGVNFVQVLEPKNVGHYENKDVLLEPKHLQELDAMFIKMNHDPAYSSYPTLLYHGYSQRHVGCFSGSRNIYIDSAGDIHACPFCHTKSYNILDLIRNGKELLPPKEKNCPRYEKTV